MTDLPPLPDGAVLDSHDTALPPLPSGAALDPQAKAASPLPPLPDGATLDRPTTSVPPGDRSGVLGNLETAGRALGGAAIRVAGDVPFLTAGVAGAVGATDTADSLFGLYDKSREAAATVEGPRQTSIGGRVAEAVGALPAGVLSLGANAMVEPSAGVLKEGGSIGEAAGQLGLNTAANLAGVGVGSLGKTITQRVLQQGATSGALGEAARVAGNALRSPDQQQPFDPVELGINVGAAAGLGALQHSGTTAGPLSRAAVEATTRPESMASASYVEPETRIATAESGPETESVDDRVAASYPTPTRVSAEAPVELRPELELGETSENFRSRESARGRASTMAAENAEESTSEQRATEPTSTGGLDSVVPGVGNGEAERGGPVVELPTEPASDAATGNPNTARLGTDAAYPADLPPLPAGAVLDSPFNMAKPDVEAAARAAATHPDAEVPATLAQQLAGNQRMGHVDLHGLDVTIEVPKGGMRRGIDKTGNPWEREVSDHYGYIKSTEGADGEQFDVYLGPHAEDPNAKVFVIDQVKPGTDTFDESKAMIGYKTDADARSSYEANFPKGLNTFGGIKEMSLDDFKQWVKSDAATQPSADAPLPSKPAFELGTLPHATADHFSAIDKAVRDARKDWGDNAPNVRVVPTAKQLPGYNTADARFDRARGLHDPDSGRVYIVADKVGSPAEAIRTLAHEAVGHYGIEAILNDHVKGGWAALTKDTERLRNDRTLGTEKVRAVLDEVESRYRDERTGGPADPTTFAREFLAVAAEKGLRNGFVMRAIAALRTWIRKTFGKDLRFSEADLLGLLKHSHDFITAGTPMHQRQAAVAAMNFDQAPKTDTPEFRKFFAGSKVVDAKGGPLIVHHGTGEAFNVFRDDKLGATNHATAALGHHFTTSRARAENYARNASEGVPAHERVIDAYLSIKKPYEMSLKEAHAIETLQQARALKAKLRSEGYDGIQTKEADTWIAFDSGQAKSTENRGTYDRSNPDIRFSLESPPARDANPNFSAETKKPRIGEFRAAAQAVKQVARDNRENARGDIRAAFARSERNVGTADAAMETFRKEFDSLVRTHKGDPKKVYASISALERGEKVYDPVARSFWEASGALLKEQLDRLNALGAEIPERDHYFAHIWKNQGREATAAAGTSTRPTSGAPGRRPFSGSRTFTNERVFNTILDGLNAGREPISTNPVDMFMARYAQGEKLAAALTIRQALADRGFVRDLENDRVPLGYSRVNDGVFAGKALPELIATDLNNHLDPGLGRFKGWREFRYVQNLMLSARLGLSAFHAGMTTLDQMASHVDVGLRRAFSGDLAGAMRELGRATVAPLTTIQELAGKGAGSKLMRQWFGQEAADANTAALLHMAMEGGARARMSATDYNRSLQAFRRAWAQGRPRIAAVQALPAALEATTHHIAQNLVPAQKMTARVMLLKFELDKRAGELGTNKGDYAATIDRLAPDAMRQISRKINADVDDRLGQFAYDNEFWNKTVKDALHASVQSVGWNFGSLRLLVGGALDARRLVQPEGIRGSLDKEGTLSEAKMSRLTGRLSYLVTLNALVATMGALTQYALTGQGPQEPKDFFFPRTGRKNADDSDERLAFPSYVKDEYAFSHHPVQTIEHKLHPALSMLVEIAKNKDFYGTQVFDPNADIPTEAKQFLTYLGKSFLPYSLQGVAKNAGAGDNAAMAALPLIGITPAPGDVARSPFQEFVARRYFDMLPQGARTQEQAERSTKFREAVQAARAGEKPDLSGFTVAQIRSLRKQAQQEVPQIRFSRITFLDKLRAWDLASPEERTSYGLRASIVKAARREIAKLPQDQRPDVSARVRAIGATAWDGEAPPHL